jgi:hypothetical protein
MRISKGKSGFDEVVDLAAERIRKEPGRIAQDIIYEVSEEYGIEIGELAQALGKRKKGRKKVKVKCEIEYTQREDEFGKERDCVVATCGKCGHETMSWGQGEGSVKRCLAIMREECEEGEENFYIQED